MTDSLGLESLNRTLQEAFALASSRLWRRRVEVRQGCGQGEIGIVQSVALGARGEIIATVKVDRPFGPRLRLKLDEIAIRETVDDIQPGGYRRRKR